MIIPGSPPARQASAAIGAVPPTPPPPSPAKALPKNRAAVSTAETTGPALASTLDGAEPVEGVDSGTTVPAANEYRDMVPGKVIVFSQKEDMEICEILQKQQAGGGIDCDWTNTAKELTAAGKLGPEKDGSMIHRRAEDLQRILFSAGPEELWTQ